MNTENAAQKVNPNFSDRTPISSVSDTFQNVQILRQIGNEETPLIKFNSFVAKNKSNFSTTDIPHDSIPCPSFSEQRTLSPYAQADVHSYREVVGSPKSDSELCKIDPKAFTPKIGLDKLNTDYREINKMKEKLKEIGLVRFYSVCKRRAKTLEKSRNEQDTMKFKLMLELFVEEMNRIKLRVNGLTESKDSSHHNDFGINVSALFPEANEILTKSVTNPEQIQSPPMVAENKLFTPPMSPKSGINNTYKKRLGMSPYRKSVFDLPEFVYNSDDDF